MGYKMAANVGWLSGLGGAVGGPPGVFTSGQIAKPSFRQAPDFTLQMFSGESLRLSDLRGKPVMVNFWASWCPPCREEAPLLEDAWREYSRQGVVFVGVNVWDGDKDARTFLSEYNITYPNGRDSGTGIAIDYGLSGIPETFFIDRQGDITRKWLGPVTEETLRAFLDEVMAKETRPLVQVCAGRLWSQEATPPSTTADPDIAADVRSPSRDLDEALFAPGAPLALSQVSSSRLVKQRLEVLDDAQTKTKYVQDPTVAAEVAQNG